MIVMPIVIGLVLVGIFAPFFYKKSSDAKISTCVSNQRHYAMFILMAADELSETDSGIRAPIADAYHFPEGQQRCPATPNQSVGYGCNAELQGKAMKHIKDPSHVILTADCINSSGYFKSEAEIAHRHAGGFVASYLDGHMRYVKKDGTIIERD